METLGKVRIRADLHRLTLEIGRRLHRARKIARLTQTDLAEKLGVSLQQVQKYENGLTRISAASLTVVAAALEVTVQTLVGDTGEVSPDPFEGLLTVEGIRLLRAFAKVQPELRHSILNLVEAMADQGG